MAVVVPGSTLTIAKVIAKVVEREKRDMANGTDNPAAGLGVIPPMSDYTAPARDTEADREGLRNAVMIQIGTGHVKLRDEVVGRSDFTLDREASVELVAAWPKTWVQKFDELIKKRQVTELMELVETAPTPEIYSFREPQTKKGTKLKQCMFRVKLELDHRYTFASGKKGLFVQRARRAGAQVPWREPRVGA